MTLFRSALPVLLCIALAWSGAVWAKAPRAHKPAAKAAAAKPPVAKAKVAKPAAPKPAAPKPAAPAPHGDDAEDDATQPAAAPPKTADKAADLRAIFRSAPGKVRGGALIVDLASGHTGFEDGADKELSLVLQCQRDADERYAMDIVGGPVQGIDNPAELIIG